MANEIQGQEKASPKHVFLHLFVIIVLYYSTVNFLILLFQFINRWSPDQLAVTSYYEVIFNSGLIRFALASLIIVFPVFIFTAKYLRKIYAASPAIREMKIRRWLIYFTLFVAALVIVGDLVRTILTFLEGEMTSRFILKALAVLIVAAAIFFYYLRDLKHEKLVTSTKCFVWIVIVAVIGTIVAGFFIIGSPKTERLRRFDLDRVSRLQGIQYQIINYWRSKEYLPAVLTDLNDKISGFEVPVDPETNQTFEYTIKSADTFELCATFNLVSEEELNKQIAPEMYQAGLKTGSESWTHGAGRTCFERTIDKQLYPPYPVPVKN